MTEADDRQQLKAYARALLDRKEAAQGNYEGDGELCRCGHPDTVHGDTTSECMECTDDHTFNLETAAAAPTPGPWGVVVPGDDAAEGVLGWGNGPARAFVATAEDIADYEWPNFWLEHERIAEVKTVANARLIAAAPSLLAAARGMVTALDEYDGTPGVIERATDTLRDAIAIAEATGS